MEPAVSPFRQSATSHLFRNYLFNGYRRLAVQLPYWLVPVGIGTSIPRTPRSLFLTDVYGCEMQQVTASTHGLRRRTLGRTARRGISLAHRTRYCARNNISLLWKVHAGTRRSDAGDNRYVEKVGVKRESPCEEMAWVPVLANRDLEFSTRRRMMLGGQRSADQGNEWLLGGMRIGRNQGVYWRGRGRDGYRKGIVSSGDR